jgi:hypothetical protein
MAYRRIFPLLLSVLAIHAGAAELGEPRVSSYKGQALVADIELSGLDNPAGAVQVRVANPDVYRGASLAVPAVLSALTLSVVQKGGKPFVHVTSNRPVDTDMLHLFLELGQGNVRDVRLATLWLPADPRPAPPPPPPPPPPVAAVAPVAAAPLPAPVPPPEAPPPERRIAVHAPAPLHLAAVNTALPRSVRAVSPASCKASASSNACAVLDTKNVALQAKLVGLEDKIKLLEATLAPTKAAAATTATAAAALTAPPADPHAPTIVPPLPAIKAAPVPVLVTPKKPKPAVLASAPAPSATPWIWIGVAATVGLAALGAIVWLLLRWRRNKAPKPAGVPTPAVPKITFIASLKQRFARNKPAPAEA